MKKYSAIVMNWNESHIAVDTVRRLLSEDIDIVVVDNGSDDGSQEKFKEFGNHIKLVLMNKNYGSSIARNAAMQLVECDRTFLIDGDILYVYGTIEKYSEIMDENPKAGIVGHYNTTRHQTKGVSHGVQDLSQADTHIGDTDKISDWYPMAWTQYGLFRTELLRKYKFVTEPPFNQFGYGHEDIWFFYDMRKDGWESLSVDVPNYYHDAHYSVRQLKKYGLPTMLEEREALFSRRWGAISKSDIWKLPQTTRPFVSVSSKGGVTGTSQNQSPALPAEVDVVMLSCTKDKSLFDMTQYAIDSLHESEPLIKFNVILIESAGLNELSLLYKNCSVITPDSEFNYNRYMNIGINLCKNEFIVMVNNDVIFTKGWFQKIHSPMYTSSLDSACPYCPVYCESFDVPEYQICNGSEIGKQLFGFCIVTKKSTLEKIGRLDERFEFWFQDDDYGKQLQIHNLRHALVKSSIVHHLGMKSHRLLEPDELQKKTNGMKDIFDKKYDK